MKMWKGLKYIFKQLVWPGIIAYATSGCIWISYIWYVENGNLDKALVSLAFGIFFIFQKDLFGHSSLSKETSE